MKKAVVTALMLALAVSASGCGEKKDDNVTIIGGADGPTSIYLAPSSVSEGFRYADPIDGDEYYAVIDRILGEYGLEGQEWGTVIDLKGETDAVVSLALEPTGRYKALGIISKEAGCYGIILNDTIDGTQDNVNYAYEAWAYTAKAEDKPEFKWEGDRLYFTYPVQSDNGIETRTVPIDCGYDTGHMEFNMERKDMASVNQEDVLSGTWQTASIGYEMDGEMQPEYYETWNEEEFGDAYRGGSSLSRCN